MIGATYATPCETMLRDRTVCGAAAVFRYAAKSGGYHHLCRTHAARHLRYCEGADGYVGRSLTDAALPEDTAPERVPSPAPVAPGTQRAAIVALVESRAETTMREIVAALGLTTGVAHAEVSRLIALGRLVRLRIGVYRGRTPDDPSPEVPVRARRDKSAAGLRQGGRRARIVQLLRASQREYSTTDVAEAFGIGQVPANADLARLVDAGHLVRVRTGVYRAKECAG